jgi:molybdenum cofactor synthesis domain-containing protein
VNTMRSSDRTTLTFAVIVVSTSRSHKSDKVIPALQQWIEQSAQGSLTEGVIVKDQIEAIQAAVKSVAQGDAQVILLSGGTGVSPDDVTPEALEPLLDRCLPGFDEGMRRFSESKTPYALVSRGVSGIYKQKLVISLPGSPNGAVENIDYLLPVLAHTAKKVAGDRTPCQNGADS